MSVCATPALRCALLCALRLWLLVLVVLAVEAAEVASEASPAREPAPAPAPRSVAAAAAPVAPAAPLSLLLLAGELGRGLSQARDFPHVDSATLTMMACLVGVPMITAVVAFLLMEINLRPQARRWEESHHAPAGGSSWTPPPHHGGQSRRASAGTSGRLPTNPASLVALSEPPSLLSDPPPRWSLPGTAPPGTAPTAAPQWASGGGLHGVGDAAEGDARVSPLSTALLVKNPSGVLVRLDGDLEPHPERRTVDVVAAKDGGAVLRALLQETDALEASILLETKAKSIPIAMLDTRSAVFPKGEKPPLAANRRVVLHRVQGDDVAMPGPACACVVAADDRTFCVYYLVGDVGIALTVRTDGSGVLIDQIIDAQGQLVAKGEVVNDGLPALWVKQGVDMALISCVAIAVQKLGVGKTGH